MNLMFEMLLTINAMMWIPVIYVIKEKNDYGTKNVKTTNRKRVELSEKNFSKLYLSKTEYSSYIREYCSDLVVGDNAFSIGNIEVRL